MGGSDYWHWSTTTNSATVYVKGISGGIASGSYVAPKPKPDGPLEWLDRRVDEMRVKL